MFMEVILVTQRNFEEFSSEMVTVLVSCLRVMSHLVAYFRAMGTLETCKQCTNGFPKRFELSILDFKSGDSVGSISRGPLIWDNLFK